MEYFYPEQRAFQRSELCDDLFSRTAGYAYLSLSFREALAALYYGLESGTRVLMLSADSGLGKTTLMRHLERTLQRRSRTLFFSLDHDNGSEVLRGLLDEIDGTAAGDDLVPIGAQVDKAITGVTEAEKPFVLLLDQNEDAEQSALEVLRHLASLESFGNGSLRVVIAGSCNGAERLRHSEFAVQIRFVSLAPLTAGEVQTYIDHRLRLAGSRGGRLFTAGACELIAKRSAGNPLAINEICFNLLQDLEEGESGRSDSQSSDRDSILDEYHVNAALSGRKPRVQASVISSNPRTVVLAGIVLMLVLAVACLWYRRASETRVAGKPASKAASTPVRDGKAAWVARVESSAAAFSPTPGRTTSYDTDPLPRPSIVPPVLTLSPATAALNHTAEHPIGTVAKKEHDVVTVSPPRLSYSRQTATSSAVAQQTAVAGSAVVRRARVGPRRGTKSMHSADGRY